MLSEQPFGGIYFSIFLVLFEYHVSTFIIQDQAEKNDVPEKTDDGQRQNTAEIATGAKTGRAQGAAPLSAHSQTAMVFAEYVAAKVLERIEPLILRLTNAAR